MPTVLQRQGWVAYCAFYDAAVHVTRMEFLWSTAVALYRAMEMIFWPSQAEAGWRQQQQSDGKLALSAVACPPYGKVGPSLTRWLHKAIPR